MQSQEPRGRPAPGLRAKIRRTRDWVLQPERDEGEGTPYLGLRLVVAVAIVVVSTSSAVAAWRAETLTEYAGQFEAVYRQELASMESDIGVDEQAVASDAGQLSRLEQHAALGAALERDAVRARGDARTRLRLAAVDQRTLVNLALARDFEAQVPYASGATVQWDPAPALRYALANDVELERLQPAVFRSRAATDRRWAVEMTVVAALFVVALVLLTVCDVLLVRPREQARSRGYRVVHALPVAAAVVWVGAVVWFTVIVLGSVRP